jgi:hypothetical protein
MPMKKADEATLLGGDSIVVHLARGDVRRHRYIRDGEKIRLRPSVL